MAVEKFGNSGEGGRTSGQPSNPDEDLNREKVTTGQPPQVEGDDGATKYEPVVTEELLQRLELSLDEGAARAGELNDPQELIDAIYASLGMIEELPADQQRLMYDAVNKRVRTMIENGDLGDNLKLLPQQLESLLDEGAAIAKESNNAEELIRAMHRSLEMIKKLPPDVQGLMHDIIIDPKISTMRDVIDNKLIEEIKGINEEQIEGIIGKNTDDNL